jgi:hypothetical protein
MTMGGIWERAFETDWLAFRNGILSTEIKSGVGLVELQIGGEVRIGDLDSGREIIAQAYLGIYPLCPQQNYFYGSINSASVGSIFRAFGLSIPLPSVLSQFGFPNGLHCSFAYDDIDLPGGIVVPRGFKLNGTVNILGYPLEVLIDPSMPSGIN